MAGADIICPGCGWRNKPSARKCASCGRMLYASSTAATSRSASGSDAPATYAPEPEPFVIAEAEEPMPFTDHSAPTWPGVEQPTYAERGGNAASFRRRPLWRAPLITLLVFALLAACGVGLWALVVRPALHQQADSALHTALDDGVSQIPQAPPFLPIGALPTYTFTYTLTASQADTLLQSQLPADLPISNVHVHFQQGTTLITYSTAGQQGTITTHLVIANGRVSAQGTTVDGPLGWVESGDEFQRTANQSLSNIPTMYHINSLSANNDNLNVSLTV